MAQRTLIMIIPRPRKPGLIERLAGIMDKIQQEEDRAGCKLVPPIRIGERLYEKKHYKLALQACLKMQKQVAA
ncbi:MAG TPA: hypothetical protein VHP58_05770 [Alphaproteobacteria bacterium]|nr:hypothetical protein [Alphaproteobacteria bacterium]